MFRVYIDTMKYVLTFNFFVVEDIEELQGSVYSDNLKLKTFRFANKIY